MEGQAEDQGWFLLHQRGVGRDTSLILRLKSNESPVQLTFREGYICCLYFIIDRKSLFKYIQSVKYLLKDKTSIQLLNRRGGGVSYSCH